MRGFTHNCGPVDESLPDRLLRSGSDIVFLQPSSSRAPANREELWLRGLVGGTRGEKHGFERDARATELEHGDEALGAVKPVRASVSVRSSAPGSPTRSRRIGPRLLGPRLVLELRFARSRVEAQVDVAVERRRDSSQLSMSKDAAWTLHSPRPLLSDVEAALGNSTVGSQLGVPRSTTNRAVPR